MWIVMMYPLRMRMRNMMWTWDEAMRIMMRTRMVRTSLVGVRMIMMMVGRLSMRKMRMTR